MRVILAPMEGVLDHLMREMLTEIGGYDLCVTEFIRVVDQLISKKAFYRSCPELKQAGQTKSGTPVRVQLLGQHPQWLAENAIRAIELGSNGIDLNFGCPAKAVNKSKGGAVLLKEPETIYKIIKAVRDVLPSDVIVSAKIRLGYEDKSLAIENGLAVESAGANELTIHARTKVEGYKPPAHWHWITKIKEQVNIPIIANGDIWTVDDALKCQEITQCTDLMVGRGALATPNLANILKQHSTPMNWEEVRILLLKYTKFEVYGDKSKYYPNRIKQWFCYLRLQYPEAENTFRQIRRLKTAQEIIESLSRKNSK